MLWRYEPEHRNSRGEWDHRVGPICYAIYRGPERVGETADVVTAGEIVDAMNARVPSR